MSFLVAALLVACGLPGAVEGSKQAVPPTVQAQVTAERVTAESGLEVHVAAYPRPDYEGEPWSHWGQGIVLPDGRYLSAMGDHIGRDGNAYVFVYDPETRELVRFADTLSLLGQEAGHWGYGKFHSQMVMGSDGLVYFTSYWGTRRDIVYDDVYQGDWLFSLDPDTLEITPLTVPVPRHGIPSLAADAERGLLLGEAVDPGSNQGSLFVYDVDTRRVEQVIRDPRHAVFRFLMKGPQGRWFLSGEGPDLLVYAPGSDELGVHEHPMPGPRLRAVTPATSDGRVYGVTRLPPEFFRMEPSGEIEHLGTALAYTTSLALTPDERGFLHIPDAHGGAWQHGAPLIRVDGETGAQETLLELQPLAEEHLGFRLGGSYSVRVDRERERVFVTLNASSSMTGPSSAFGEVVLFEFPMPRR